MHLRKPGTTRILQAKLIPDGKAEEALIDIVKAHSTRPVTVQDIDKVDSFDVYVLIDDPPIENLKNVHGWTSAELLKGDQKLLTIGGGDDIRTDRLNVMLQADKISVNVWVNKKSTVLDQQVAIVHEFERHVFPLYNMFLTIRKCDLLSKYASPQDAWALVQELSQQISRGDFTAKAQHDSADLAARQVVAIMTFVCESLKGRGKEEYEDILSDPDTPQYQMLTKARNDTVAQGVSLQAMQGVYTPMLAGLKQKYGVGLVNFAVNQFEEE